MAQTTKIKPEFQQALNELKKDLITSVGSMFMEQKEDIKRIDTKVTQLDSKVTHLNSKVTQLDFKVFELDGRVTRLSEDVRTMGKDIRGVLRNHETRIQKLETEI